MCGTLPEGLFRSGLVGSVRVNGSSVSNSEVVSVDGRSGDGLSAVVKTVVSRSTVLLVVEVGDRLDGVEGAGGGLVGTDSFEVGTKGGIVGTCGSAAATESLKLVVTTSEGDGVIRGVGGGSSVTAIEGVAGGGSVGLVVGTAPGREIVKL